MSLKKSNDSKSDAVVVKDSRKESSKGYLSVKVYVKRKQDSDMPERDSYANRTVVRVNKERARAAFKKAENQKSA